MRWDKDIKRIRMIPAPRHATAAGVTASAATYGSGGSTSGRGIVDTLGYDWALLTAEKSSGSAAKASWRFYEQSGAATLIASATAITSALASGITTSRTAHGYWLNLRTPTRKRYLNAILVTSTTCGMTNIACTLFKGDSFPPSFNGFTVTRNL